MKPVKSYWTYAKAEKLLDEKNVCCKILKRERLIPMLPKYIGKCRTGIKEVIDVDLGKYTEWVGGVLLGYSKMRVSQTSLPLDDQPLISYTVAMNVIVFQPSVGKTLKCTVNEVAPDHIGCLALDYFNVSIPVPKAAKNKHGKKGDSDLPPGTQLLVKVNKIQNMHGIISIHGTLQSVISRPVASTSHDSEEVPMDTTVSDVESTASVTVVPSQTKPTPTVTIASSDHNSSRESSLSPRKKKKKKKSSKESSKSIKSESVTETSFDDLDSSFASPHVEQSVKLSKKAKKRKKDHHEKETTFASSAADTSMSDLERFTEVKSDPERSLDAKIDDSMTSSGKKKKKHKQSKSKISPIKVETLSGADSILDQSSMFDADNEASFNISKEEGESVLDLDQNLDEKLNSKSPKKKSKKDKRKSTHSQSNSSFMSPTEKTKKKHKQSKDKPVALTIKSETNNNESDLDSFDHLMSNPGSSPSKSSKTKKRKSNSHNDTVNGSLVSSITALLDSLPNSAGDKLPNSAVKSEKKAKKRKHSSVIKEEPVVKQEALDRNSKETDFGSDVKPSLDVLAKKSKKMKDGKKRKSHSSSVQ